MQKLGPLPWVGGEHMFFLGLGQIRALQDATGLGPYMLYQRICRNDWRVDDLMSVLRLGLIGADAMSDEEASTFVTELFRKHALMEFVSPAVSILAHVLMQPDSDEVGKIGPAGKERPTQPDASSSAPSTVMPPE